MLIQKVSGIHLIFTGRQKLHSYADYKSLNWIVNILWLIIVNFVIRMIKFSNSDFCSLRVIETFVV